MFRTHCQRNARAMAFPIQPRILPRRRQGIHASRCSRLGLRRTVLLSVLLLVAVPSFSAPPPKPVKVLVLYFADKDSPGVNMFLVVALRARMEHELNAPVWIYEESFDEGWLGYDPAYERTLEAFLQHKYAQRGIDILMTMGGHPLDYVQKRRKTLLPGAKLLYFTMGSSPPRSVPDATGLVWKFDLAPTLEIALLQNPATRHVLLIAGATAVDRAWAQVFLATGQKYLQEKHSNVDLQVIPRGTIDETRSRLAALPQGTIPIFVAYFGDSAGQGFVAARIIGTFASNANRPMYTWMDNTLGCGIVGGSIMKTDAIGVPMGDLAARVLRGEKPESIPEVRWGFQRYEFDWPQLKRWGIGMDKVPAGSTVINREYSFWELYKWRIIGLIVLILVEAALIVALVRLAAAQKRSLKQLAYQRERETLVAQLAGAFINLPADLVNLEIEKSFQGLLEFFDLDRISLFEYSAETAQLRLLCFRATPGGEPPPPILDLRMLTWTASQILRGKPIVASRLSELPEEATALKEILRSLAVRSIISLPLRHDEHTFATLSFSTVRSEREWKPDLVQALQTVADIFGNALERKYAEEAVRESQGRLNNIIESAMDAIIVVDSQQRIVVFNPAAEKVFGYSVRETAGQPLERLIPHRFRARYDAHISRFATGGVTNRLVGMLRGLWALRADGKECRIEVSLSRVETHGESLVTIILRDITERERAEHALRESEQLKTSILDSLSSHVAVVDSRGIVVAVTDRKFDFALGNRLLEPPVGTNYFEMCRSRAGKGDLELTATLDGMEAVFDGRRDHFELEYAFLSATEQVWLLMSVTPLKGSGRGIVISHHDITERKRHERAIQELSGRLINAQELERSRIARELHDDINQRLAVLAIELQQLDRFVPEDSLQGRQKIEGLWKKTHGLSTDLQHLSHQLHSTKLEHLGIIAALRGLCGEFSEQHKIGADFQFRQVPTLDSEISLHLFRVAQESLHNVAKHSRAKKVRMELAGTDGRIVLRVTDDGVGFDTEVPISQTGLGMTSMSERIRYVGGTLSVWSRPSMGTQVEATIPVTHRTAAVNRAAPPVSIDDRTA